MDINYLIIQVAHHYFIAALPFDLGLSEIIVTVLNLPAHAELTEQVDSCLAIELLLCQGPQVAKASICYHHINLILQMSGADTTQRPSIHSNLPFDSYSQFQIVEHLFSIGSELPRVWSSFRPSISPVIPNQAIHLFVKEVLEVVSMWIIDHMLVCHRIWIAQNERVVL